MRHSSFPPCRFCGGAGWRPGPARYPGLGTSLRAFCRRCAKGRSLERDWARAPEQQSHARRARRRRVALALERSCMGPELAEASLPSLLEEPAARALCVRYLREWPAMAEAGKGLHIWGPAGSGKTRTAAALARALIEAHIARVLFVSVPELAERLEVAGGDPDDSDAGTLVRAMAEAGLLVLDGLGQERPSGRLGMALLVAASSRARDRLPTLVASRLSPSALRRRYPPLAAALGPRSTSVRLAGGRRPRRGR